MLLRGIIAARQKKNFLLCFNEISMRTKVKELTSLCIVHFREENGPRGLPYDGQKHKEFIDPESFSFSCRLSSQSYLNHFPFRMQILPLRINSIF